jgi:hypothetical protein
MAARYRDWGTTKWRVLAQGQSRTFLETAMKKLQPRCSHLHSQRLHDPANGRILGGVTGFLGAGRGIFLNPFPASNRTSDMQRFA